MGLGVARAVANAGKTGKIAIIRVDGIKDALEAVKSGDVTAVVAQYPYAIGAMGVQACQAAAAGKTLPKNVEGARSSWSPRTTPTQALAEDPEAVRHLRRPARRPSSSDRPPGRRGSSDHGD